VPKATPEERAAIEVRLAALRARMIALDCWHDPEYMAEWNALSEVREALEKELRDDP
jgi:hypothetical protein